MAHKFCRTCGTSVLGRTLDGRCGINLRVLADVDFDSLPVLASDGAATEPLYQVPEPVAVDNVRDKITSVKDCNQLQHLFPAPSSSSTNAQDGALWTYPPTTAVTFKGLDSLTTYHGFCKLCGQGLAIIKKDNKSLLPLYEG
ncbi:hypothetical protein K438DRAFT_1848926, partial [Mycena galopus ATCC 62051]